MICQQGVLLQILFERCSMICWQGNCCRICTSLVSNQMLLHRRISSSQYKKIPAATCGVSSSYLEMKYPKKTWLWNWSINVGALGGDPWINHNLLLHSGNCSIPSNASTGDYFYWIDFPNCEKIGSCWISVFFSFLLKNLDWVCVLETLGDALI